MAIVNATPTPFDREAAVTVTADVGAVMLDLLEGSAREPMRSAATFGG